MKKTKLLAVLSAAMLGCCAMGGAAFAEETEPVDYSKYQMGDINLNGEVDIDDAQIALRLYTEYLVGRTAEESYLRNGITAEQAKLGDIVSYKGTDLSNDLSDAFYILSYYADNLSRKNAEETVSEYVQRLINIGMANPDIIVNDRSL